MCEDDILSEEEVIDVQKALENVGQGNVKSIEQVAKEVGITPNTRTKKEIELARKNNKFVSHEEVKEKFNVI